MALIAAALTGAVLSCLLLAFLRVRRLRIEERNTLSFARSDPMESTGMPRRLQLPHSRKSRGKERSRQLADTLPLVAEMLRGGSSPETAFATVAASIGGVLGSELSQMSREVSMANRTLTQALESLARRTGDANIDLLANAVAIQKEGGGNLADLLDSLAEGAQKRQEMKGHLDAITSSARMSAALVGAMPPAMLALLSLASPNYLEDFWRSGLWAPILALVAVLDLSGLALIRRLYRLDLS